ncbi:hypothetical protein TCAL_15636 [Tigriopus californicus]|uniref:Uncharacterized protein n=1 Tax=Tigriopus californicus TaxID=6832 RepID=A0A553PAJ7_TIGCA|nr:hypothetical protein TCAL_15636 [Tigriopus californicus]
MESVSVDLFDLKGRTFIVMVDWHSGYLFLKPLTSSTTEAVWRVLYGWFCLPHGSMGTHKCMLSLVVECVPIYHKPPPHSTSNALNLTPLAPPTATRWSSVPVAALSNPFRLDNGSMSKIQPRNRGATALVL